MCSRLLSMQLQFWSAWTGIINLAGGHVWVGGGCRLGGGVGRNVWGCGWWVKRWARKVSEVFWTKKGKTLSGEFCWGAILECYCWVGKKMKHINFWIMHVTPIQWCFLWQQLTQTVAGNQTQKQRPKLEVSLKFPLESVWVSSFRSKLVFWSSVKFTPSILEMSEN